MQGALAGQVIHAMLEQINDLVHNEVLDLDRFDKRFEAICISLGVTREEETKPLRDRSINDIRTFISSDFGKFVLSCGTFFTELPVQTQLDHQNSLYGIVDRLFQEPDGSWHLLDYKTGTSRREANKDQYAFQLRYYASLIKRLYPDAAKIKSTIFYTQLGVIDQQSYDVNELAGVESSFLSIIDGIRSGEKIPELKLLERKLAHCEYCNYYSQKKQACVVPLD